MSGGPSVSLCIPTWNGGAFLRETLESALGQTHADLEILVVDDGSWDSTLDVAGAFRDPRLRLRRNTHRLGIPGNWNRCLELARAPYVQLLCQDDTLAPTAVERLVSALASAPEAPLAFGRRRIRHEGEDLHRLPLRGDVYESALRGFYASLDGPIPGARLVEEALSSGRDPTVNVVGEPSFVLLRRSAAMAAGGFDRSLGQIPDWELWLRLARQGPLVFVDEVLGVFRVHGLGASARNVGRLRTVRELLRLLGLLDASYGPLLPADARRALGRWRWRYRRHLAGEAARRLIPSLGRG